MKAYYALKLFIYSLLPTVTWEVTPQLRMVPGKDGMPKVQQLWLRDTHWGRFTHHGQKWRDSPSAL